MVEVERTETSLGTGSLRQARAFESPFSDEIEETIQASLEDCDEGWAYYDKDADARPVYRALGLRGLLAPHLPREYGGRAGQLADLAAVSEELSRFGVSDLLHYLSVHYAGWLLWRFGSTELKRRYLPRIASGEVFFSILYTEESAGSDLASLSTHAFADGRGGYVLHGQKLYSVKTSLADFALTAARTGAGRTKYDDITLFVVDLRARGVCTERLRSITSESFHRVVLKNLKVSDEDVLGEIGGGWGLLTEGLAIERLGLDYVLKAKRWLSFARTGSTESGYLRRLSRRVLACEHLVRKNICRIDRGEALPPPLLAATKVYSSELARDAGSVVARSGLSEDDPDARSEFQSLIREAPTTTISGGVSEVLLEVVASTIRTVEQMNGHESRATEWESILERAFDRLIREALDARTLLLKIVDLNLPSFDINCDRGGFALGNKPLRLLAGRLGRSGRNFEFCDLLAASRLHCDLTGRPSERPVILARSSAPTLVGQRVRAPAFAVEDASILVVDQQGCRVTVLGREHVTKTEQREELGVEIEELMVVSDPEESIHLGGERLSRLIETQEKVRRGLIAHYVHGLAEGAFDLTVRRLSDRRQFGGSLLDLQGVRLEMARCRTALWVCSALLAGDSNRTEEDLPAEPWTLQFSRDELASIFRRLVQLNGASGFTETNPISSYHLEYLRVLLRTEDDE